MGRQQTKISSLVTIVSLIAVFMQFASANRVEFNPKPLLSGKAYPPNVPIAVSAEWPVLSPAYYGVPYKLADGKGDMAAGGFDLERLKEEHYGIYDANKCYTYVRDNPHSYTAQKNDHIKYASTSEGGYFVPSSIITDKTYHLCSGSKEEWSGNLLNMMNTTVMDIFRKTLTGGNRAFGVGTDLASYAAGDTPTTTYIRRGFVPRISGIQLQFRYRRLQIPTATMRRITPYAKADIWFSQALLNYQFRGSKTTGFYIQIAPDNIEVAKNANVAEAAIIGNSGNAAFIETETIKALNLDALVADETQGGSTQKALQVFNNVVKVCDTALGVENLELNCVAYPQPSGQITYKPEGLMQRYGKEMRFSVFGYLNRNRTGNDNNANPRESGGLMRARMKSITEDSVTTSLSGKQYRLTKEINPKTGQFIQNPDPDDVATGGEGTTDSGIINYLNKFGDRVGLRDGDPIAQVHYSALRYLRGMGNLKAYSDIAFEKNAWTGKESYKAEREGFPIITDWDDPLVGDNVCRKNSIIFVGDTNGMPDNFLPGFPLGNFITDDTVDFKGWKIKALQAEKDAGTLNLSQATPDYEKHGAAMVGAAYWANVNDIRADMDGMQTVTTLAVDVLELSSASNEGYRFKDRYNMIYLAGKYGGFTPQTPGEQSIKSRLDWTDDIDGRTSISQFRDGVPRAYGAGWNPKALAEALEKSFAAASANVYSIAPLTTNVNKTGTLTADDFLLQSTYNPNNKWSGDVIAHSIKDTNDGTDRLWSIAGHINSQFIDDNWKNRMVFVSDGNANISRFNQNLWSNLGSANKIKVALDADGRGSFRVDYILGDKSQEGRIFRARPSLVGAVVNASPIAIPAKNEKAPDCDYADIDYIKDRKQIFAFPSNDGMFHVVDHTFQEKLAFLPKSAFDSSLKSTPVRTVSKAELYSREDYPFEFINDGTPVTKEMCLPSVANPSQKEARSVIVGTTGRGGNSVYALDVTYVGKTSPSKDNILWEFSDSDMGYTVHKPILAYDRQGDPIAIVSSGYNEAKDNYVYILKIKSGISGWVLGTNYYKIKLEMPDSASRTNGLGAISAVDSDADGKIDALYTGDSNGYIWKIDTKDANINQWAVAFNGKPYFQAVDDAGKAQPIVSPPLVEEIDSKKYIFFATGKYFGESDIKMSTQSAYGIIERGNASIGDSITTNLLKQTIDTITNNGDKNLGTVTSENLTASHDGWQLNLQKNERVTGHFEYRKDILYFLAFNPEKEGSSTATKCGNANQSTTQYSLNARNGGLPQKPTLDTNGDGKVNSSDGFNGFIEYIGAIAEDFTMYEKDGNFYIAFGDGTGGIIISEIESAPLPSMVKRLSWRIVF